MRVTLAALMFTLALAATGATAQALSPDQLVKTVTDDVIASIKQNPAIKGGNTDKAVALIEQKVTPHFDFQRMAALAMGVNWRKATPEQQKTIADSFRTLLVRTYSSALSKYRDQAIDTAAAKPAGTDGSVMVRSTVRQSGTEPITIDYHMQKTANDWKVYDILVAGVSLVLNYRETFATDIRAGGVDAVIKSLEQKNRELAR